jgi:hypothetical protein
MALPKKIIQGLSVRDYAYQWIAGGCLLHQWCSGARGIDDKVIGYVQDLLTDTEKRYLTRYSPQSDVDGLKELLEYLKENKGAPAENYIPDQWK